MAVVLLLTGLFMGAELYLPWIERIDGILWRKDDIGYIFAFFLFMRLIVAMNRRAPIAEATIDDDRFNQVSPVSEK